MSAGKHGMAAVSESVSGAWSMAAARLAIVAAVISALALIVLHVLSLEFETSWRMVSEYANGDTAGY